MSDISSGSIYGIYVCIYLYIDILSDILSGILFLTCFLASMLRFSLTCFLAFFVANRVRVQTCPAAPRAGRGGVDGWGDEGIAPLSKLKSRDPHLAGGEQKKIKNKKSNKTKQRKIRLHTPRGDWVLSFFFAFGFLVFWFVACCFEGLAKTHKSGRTYIKTLCDFSFSRLRGCILVFSCFIVYFGSVVAVETHGICRHHWGRLGVWDMV